MRRRRRKCFFRSTAPGHNRCASGQTQPCFRRRTRRWPSGSSSSRSSADRPPYLRRSRRSGRVGAGVPAAPYASLLASRRGQRSDGANRRRHAAGHVFGGERRVGIRSLTTWSRLGADPSREGNRRRSPRRAASRLVRASRQQAFRDCRRTPTCAPRLYLVRNAPIRCSTVAGSRAATEHDWTTIT